MGNNEDHIRDLIVYLVANHRYMVLSLLNSNGVTIKAPGENKQIIEAVYEGIGNNNRFREALKTTMVNLAVPSRFKNKKTIDDFVKSGANIKGGFAGFIEDNGMHEDADQSGNDAGAQGNKSSFENTQVGGFFNTLFSKENINKYIDTGITLAKNKQAIKANQQNIDIAAMQLEQQRLATQNTPVQSKNNWVLPVVIGSVVLVGIIVTVFIIKSKKA